MEEVKSSIPFPVGDEVESSLPVSSDLEKKEIINEALSKPPLASIINEALVRMLLDMAEKLKKDFDVLGGDEDIQAIKARNALFLGQLKFYAEVSKSPTFFLQLLSNTPDIDKKLLLSKMDSASRAKMVAEAGKL